MFDGAAVMMGNYVLKYVHYFQKNVGGSLHLWNTLQHNFCPLYQTHWSSSVAHCRTEQRYNEHFLRFYLSFPGNVWQQYTHTHSLNVFNVPNGGKDMFYIFYFPLCVRTVVVSGLVCSVFMIRARVLLTDFPGIYELIYSE